MLKVGIVGVGFMGMVHYLSYQKIRGVKVVALCDMDTRRLKGDWTMIQGNFGPRGTKMDLKGIATYQDPAELIADDNVDMVDICLPPSAHAPIAVKALKAGKNVFCEKPMSLTVRDTNRMEAAAKAAKRTLMIGHVLPMFPEYEFAARTVASGKYGKLLGGSFKRVINDPSWLKHFYDPKVIGGPMLDLHVHDAHFIRYLFGKPTAVSTTGRMRGEVAEYFSTQFSFKNPKVSVTATGGVVDQEARSFLHGYEIHLERATILFEFAVIDGEGKVLMPCTVFPRKGKSKPAKLKGSGDPMEAFHAELKEVAKGAKSGKPAEFLRAGLAQDAIRICDRQTASLKSGKRVKV